MKYLKTFELLSPDYYQIPDLATRIDIGNLKLIDPFELSHFTDVKYSVYFYYSSKVKSHSYDDNWGWTELWTFEGNGKFKKECGYIIYKNNEPLYVVGIYQPGGIVPSKTNAASQIGGLITILGYESMINLWLDYDEYDATRIDAL